MDPGNRPSLIGGVRLLFEVCRSWILLAGVGPRRRLVTTVVAIVLVGYLGSGILVIGPGEVGLLKRLGTYRPPSLGPGLHLRWPAPLETVTKIEPDLVRLARFGGSGPSALFLTGDENLVELAAAVEYRLTEAGAAELEFGVENLDGVIAAEAEGVFRVATARWAYEQIIGAGRGEFETAAEAAVRERLKGNGWKLTVDRVRVLDARPPRAVSAAHRDVEAASADAARDRSASEAYAIERHWAARAEAQTRRDVAASSAYRIKTHADGQRQAFLLLASTHADRPDLTEFRMWWETLGMTYAGRPKLIFDPRAGGRRHVWVADPETMVLIRAAARPTRDSVNSEHGESTHHAP